MNQKIPEYLNEKGNIIRLIVYTAVFALVFINIYQPFRSREWYGVSDLKYLLFSSLIILTGVLVVVISRIIMYYYSKKKQLFVWQYAFWVLAEIISMSLFYTLFEIIFLHDLRSFNILLKESSINTSLILLLPYSTIWLYFSWKENKNKLEKLNNTDALKEPQGKHMLNFLDEKKELRLSVRSDEVLWIEAADNYVKIYYLNKGKVCTFMVRNALKYMEEYFSNTALTRCNRSVIVNFDKVRILRKEKDGIFLGLDQDNVPDIPVSKSYADRIMSKFSSYSV